MVLASPLQTQRTAFELARREYEALFIRMSNSGNMQVARLVRPAYERGIAALNSLQPRVSDVTLSSEAAEAIAAYVSSLDTDDPEAQLMWLGMLPKALRDVYRESTVQALCTVSVTVSSTVASARPVMRPRPKSTWSLRRDWSGLWEVA
jgi:gamma-glutamyl:cysteine ligase YbdK (ATP-grasp superfamily)